MTDGQQVSKDDYAAAVSAPPKKRRWRRRLKRIAICLAVLVAVYWVYYLTVDSILKLKLAALSGKGIPVTISDLDRPEVPDDQNAALLYRKAFETDYFVSKFDSYELTSEGLQIIGAEATETLALVRQARGLPGVDWGEELVITPSNINLEPMGKMNKLSRLLVLAAQQAQEKGDSAAACDYLHDTLVLGEAIYSEPFAITHLFATGIYYRASNVLESISYELDLSNPAAQKAARQLIDALADESRHLQHFTDAAIGESCFNNDAYELVRQGQYPWEIISKGLSLFVARRLPDAIVTSDQLRSLESLNALIHATRQATYPAAMRIIPPELQRKSIYDLFYNRSDFSYDLLNGSIGSQYGVITNRRMTATALAIRLYELDKGQMPETLDELVPEYLPAVPQDPFFDGVRPIGYLPNAELPVLYSVGFNGVDDGGLDQEAEGFTVGSGLLEMKFGETADILFYLTARPEVEEDTAPTTQPIAQVEAE